MKYTHISVRQTLQYNVHLHTYQKVACLKITFKQHRCIPYDSMPQKCCLVGSSQSFQTEPTEKNYFHIYLPLCGLQLLPIIQLNQTVEFSNDTKGSDALVLSTSDALQ